MTIRASQSLKAALKLEGGDGVKTALALCSGWRKTTSVGPMTAFAKRMKAGRSATNRPRHLNTATVQTLHQTSPTPPGTCALHEQRQPVLKHSGPTYRSQYSYWRGFAKPPHPGLCSLRARTGLKPAPPCAGHVICGACSGAEFA